MTQDIQQTRYSRGIDILTELNAGPGEEEIKPLDDLGRYIAEFGFGDIYSRSGLSLRDREFAAVAMLTVLGLDHQLQFHLRAALNIGVSAQELEEVVIQAALFAGFPVAINTWLLLKQAVAEVGSDGKGEPG